jgi:O-antigen/teichoic acid export membrane protein
MSRNVSIMSQEPYNFWRNVGIAFGGTALAQAIPLIGSLVIARIFAPADFGMFATWLGVAALLAVMLTGRLEAVLPIVADGMPRKFAIWMTLATAASIVCVLSLLLLIALYFFPTFLNSFSRALIWLLMPASFFIASSITWQSWAAADGRFRALAAMRIVQAGAITGIQIFVGLLTPTALGLVCGHLFGVLIALLVAQWLMPLGRNELMRGIAPWEEIKKFWVIHHRFPLYSLPADGINATAAMLPLLILTNRFGAEFAGFFALSLKVLGAPIGVLGASVLDVFKRSSAAHFRKYGHCRDDYWRTFKVLGLGALAMTIFIFLLSEPLFVFAFGERWKYSGTIAVWLMPMFALKFVASPLSYVFYIAGKQHVDLVWQIALLIMTIMTFYLPSEGKAAIQAYSLGYSILYIVYLSLSWGYSRGRKS